MTRLPAILAILVLAAAPAAAQDQPRVVSVGGDLTEIVYALGAEHLLVGTDTTSTWPAAAEVLPKVGYMRQLAAEGMLSLTPDIVLAASDTGPESVLDRLASAGVDVRIAPDGNSIEGIIAKIRFVGEAIGHEDAAAAAVERFRAQMAEVEATLEQVEAAPRVLFLISVGSGRMMAAGTNTSADAIIALAHGVNAMAAFDGYKPVNAEALTASAPDVLLLPSHSVDQLGGIESVLSDPALATTPAVRNDRVVVMDSLLLLGFGPRTPDAILELARALHTEADFATVE